MKQYNYNICDNCGEENPLYLRNCKKCSHSTRGKVVNINLWETFYNLLHAPTNTLKNIIYSEHKNFITFVLLLLSIKIYIISIVFQTSFTNITLKSDYQTLNFFAVIIIYVLVILLFTLLLTFILKKKSIYTRFKDNLSVLSYSFLFLIIGSVILLPIEYGIFGEYWFTFNPSPILIKPVPAYLLYGIEFMMFLWSLLILFKGFVLQADTYLRSVIVVISFLLTMGASIVFLPYYLF